MVRTVTATGKGEFSELFGPVTTGTERPSDVAPAWAESVTGHECDVVFTLPYNNGLPILEATLAVTRCSGPLAVHEVHPETRECHAHIAMREVSVDPREAQRPLAAPGGPPLRWLPGTTPALLRSYRDEGLEEDAVLSDGCAHSLGGATGRRCSVRLEDLRPGSVYRLQWACGNQLGWSDYSPESKFETSGHVPDQPETMTVPSL